ncbi:hypothetical protein G6011_04989 [Alternaria panax]|uniref:Uncharacterized protein n=1 Tax=Alternaria panax TaxID=48097 RepID=A0AAD4FBX1_9PLEO|nr:hypothetical protein G6011_04989 [Alternaria panax]
MDAILASLEDGADIPRPRPSGQNGNKRLSEDPSRLAARTKELQSIQQRGAERQYLALVADVQQQALAQNVQFLEGISGWEHVHPNEQELIRWAIYTNRVDSTSKKVKTKMLATQAAVPAFNPRHNSVTSLHDAADPASTTEEYPRENDEPDRNKQAKTEVHTRLKEKFESPMSAEFVYQIAVLRYAVFHNGRKWPQDVGNWDSASLAQKALVLEITQYLDLQEEFEGSDGETE